MPSPERPMVDGELLFLQLAGAISQKVEEVRSAPFPMDLWDIPTIAHVFKRTELQVRQCMVCRPDFPKAARFRSEGGGRSHALYKASDVLTWADKFKDKN
jgi:hypothetical protein